MPAGTKSFMFNRESDWKENAVFSNFYFKDDNMVCKSKNGGSAYYISMALDSGEKEVVWDRFRIFSNISRNYNLTLCIYASDTKIVKSPYIAKGNIEVNLDDYLKDNSVSIETRAKVIGELDGAKEFENVNDILLYGFKGRYLWFSVELVNYGMEDLEISGIKIEFPRIAFIGYLPEMYRSKQPKDSFLARFIGVFQSIYLDIEEKVDKYPTKFDPMQTDTEFLVWLSKWFSINDGYMWDEQKLRRILSQIVSLYKIKGTKKVIDEIVKLYTGKKGIIIEQFQLINNDFYNRNKKLIGRLFGDNGYTFSVLVDKESIADSDEYMALMKCISLFKPADSKCNLVVLNDNIYLDYHCYLGINSYIAKNERMVLDGNSIITNSTFLSDI